MKMKTEFLEFSPCLAKQIAEIEAECFSSPWSQKAIIESAENSAHFVIAGLNNTVYGYCGIETVLDEGYILNLAVAKNYRRLGIASKILEEIINYAKSKNLSFISLEVRTSNLSAIKLYERFGFKEEGLRRGFYQNPREDAKILTKRFDNI